MGVVSDQSGQSISKILSDLAPIYGLTERRLYERARQGHILGVTHRDGQWLFEYGDGVPGFQGPVPDKPTQVLLPPKIEAVSVEVLPGPVSGRVYQGPLKEGKKNATVVLYAEAHCSGVLIMLATDPQVNQPQEKQTVYEYCDNMVRQDEI